MGNDLYNKHCKEYKENSPALQAGDIERLRDQINGNWQVNESNRRISRDFKFKDFYETMAFMNAVAWIANAENHHPDVSLGYNYCTLTFSTHTVDGLSLNDFICAAKVDHLMDK